MVLVKGFILLSSIIKVSVILLIIMGFYFLVFKFLWIKMNNGISQGIYFS